MTNEPPRLLVGPQRPNICIGAAIDASGIAARSFAVISAGWQEAEGDIDDVRAEVGRPLEDVGLYERVETLFREQPELRAAYRARQDRLRELQRIYRLRLRQLAIAARHTLRDSNDPEIAAGEQRHAIRQLRALDRHHFRASEKLHREFESAWRSADNPGWQGHTDEIAARIDEHDAVLITGGNIIVLMNRMRLLGLGPLLENKPIVGWSAGAMALTTRIVLFHDRMPQGRREPEVLGAGLGLVPGTVVLPDGAHRLGKRDGLRLGLMARRFSPHQCLVLDNEASVRYEAEALVAASGARRLTRGGRLVKVTPS